MPLQSGGVTSSGTVWRKVPESEARSVNPPLYQEVELTASADDLLLGLLVSQVVCVDAVDAEDGIASLQTALLGDAAGLDLWTHGRNKCKLRTSLFTLPCTCAVFALLVHPFTRH